MALSVTLSAGCLASTQQEVALGDQYAAQIAQQLPLITDPEAARYLRVLGDSLARVSDDRDLSWTFDIVDQDEVNAFAVPGGHIYVYRGLIERMNTMSELAGVLGHEIAHVTRRHSMTQMRNQQAANVGVTVGCLFAPQICNNQVNSTLVNLGSSAAFSKFSRNDEAEADQFGVSYVTRAGIDPRGMTSLFGILMAERKRNPSGMEAFFASHPVEESRIEATQAEIRKLDPALLPTLTRDTPAFRAFKARLLALPRRPAKR